MLKNIGYGGVYHDENISVSVLLESPEEHGLEATELVFSVLLRTKNGDAPRPGDFTFYVMDATNHLYNMWGAPYLKPDPDDDEPVRRPDGLICTDWKPEFLFQDLRIAFYYRPYAKIIVIDLQR